MKLNWGTGIFIVIVLFLCACAAFIVFTFGQKWSLVEEDYYPKELRHEEKLVKMRNANALKEQILVKVDSASLFFRFPGDFRTMPFTGQIHIYRPSDEDLDFIVPIATDTALIQRIPLSRLAHGKYVVKVDWKSGEKEYYKEQEIFIP